MIDRVKHWEKNTEEKSLMPSWIESKEILGKHNQGTIQSNKLTSLLMTIHFLIKVNFLLFLKSSIDSNYRVFISFIIPSAFVIFRLLEMMFWVEVVPSLVDCVSLNAKDLGRLHAGRDPLSHCCSFPSTKVHLHHLYIIFFCHYFLLSFQL